MAFKVRIGDNTIRSAPNELSLLSPLFKETIDSSHKCSEVGKEQDQIVYTSSDDGIITLNISELTFTKLVDFVEYYPHLNKYQKKIFEYPETIYEADKEISQWYKNYIAIDVPIILELMILSHDLEIKPLSNLCYYTIAMIIKDKSPEEINNILDIKCDFTPEEKQALTEETAWVNE